MLKPIENKKNFDSQKILNPPRYLLKRWFSLSEAAIYTRYKEITLRQAVYNGELCIGQNRARGKWYFDIFQLDEWMLKNFGPYYGPIDEKPRGKDGRFIKEA